MSKFNYVEYNLENSKLLPLQDNGFQILLKFIAKKDQRKILFVKSTFIDLGNKIFSIEVNSSIYNNGNSQNGTFNFKLPILDNDKANPFLLMTKVFKKVQTSNLNKTLSNYSPLSSETFSLKLWKNIPKLGSKQDNVDVVDVVDLAATTTSTSCTPCSTTTGLGGELSGTYGTEGNCDCFTVSSKFMVYDEVTIYGNVTLNDSYFIVEEGGSLTINGDVTLDNDSYFIVEEGGSLTISEDVTLGSHFTVKGSLTIYGDVKLNNNYSNIYVDEGGSLTINGDITLSGGHSSIYVECDGKLKYGSITNLNRLYCSCGSGSCINTTTT